MEQKDDILEWSRKNEISIKTLESIAQVLNSILTTLNAKAVTIYGRRNDDGSIRLYIERSE